MSRSARLFVSPPTWQQSPYGLLASADVRTEPNSHWQMGVTWEDICGGTGTTVADCDTSAPIITGSGLIANLQSTTSRTIWGATPFTIYCEVDCSPVDYFDNADSLVAAALAKFEDFQVERAFWTGVAVDRNNQGGFANVVLPHLAANTAVTEPLDQNGISTRTVTLQLAATTVTGVALNVVDALGVLEGALVGCLGGQGMIHVPQALAPTLALLLKQQGGRLVSPNGNTVVIGGGYPGTSPAGAAPATGTCWMYATGPVMAYRSQPRLYAADPAQRFDRNVDTMKAIVERTYVLGYDCCLFAQLVNTASFIATTGTTP